MSEFRIMELAEEETIRVFPEFENTNPSYIWDLSKKAINEVLEQYSLESIESETEIRVLLFKHLKEIRKSTNLK